MQAFGWEEERRGESNGIGRETRGVEGKKGVTSAAVDARDIRKPAQAQAGETRRKTNDKRKATQQPQDEIDAVFGAALGKKVKKAELAAAADGHTTSKAASDVRRKEHKGEKRGKRKRARDEGADVGLEDVLGAIRSAPKEDKGSKKRKKIH